ncbi:hypothetical protein [Arthrobacter sp. NPDC056493]|uniref:hypothetical protein n=1 Tax=Arthrobacter sp. NPDC056493 TaxID=3345839 RepID=UPI00366AFA80
MDSGTASTEATPTPTLLPAGKFQLNTQSGAKITFELPTPATDPALAKLEAYREKTGGKPVTYVVADVDNRNGTEMLNMYQINAFDKEGREYIFGAVWHMIDLWKPTYGSDYKYTLPGGKVLDDATGDALSNEGTELYNANLDNADVAQRLKIILASSDVDLPTEFTRVSVQPSGAGQGEDALPVQG